MKIVLNRNYRGFHVSKEFCDYYNIPYDDWGTIIFPKETVIGALANYISSSNKNFQPMNANFGILPELEENIRDKKQRYSKMAERSLEKLKQIFN